jgi:hypothetical protein
LNNNMLKRKYQPGGTTQSQKEKKQDEISGNLNTVDTENKNIDNNSHYVTRDAIKGTEWESRIPKNATEVEMSIDEYNDFAKKYPEKDLSKTKVGSQLAFRQNKIDGRDYNASLRGDYGLNQDYTISNKAGRYLMDSKGNQIGIDSEIRELLNSKDFEDRKEALRLIEQKRKNAGGRIYNDLGEDVTEQVKNQYGETGKQKRVEQLKKNWGNVLGSILGVGVSKKRHAAISALNAGIQAEQIDDVVAKNPVTERGNYSPTVEVDTPAQQPQTTPTDKKVDYEWKEFTNGNDPYKYRVALDKASGNPLMYEYSKDGKTWKQQEETDKGNRTMERQSVISNLWKNYQQNPASMQPSQQRTTGRTGTGGSGRGGSRLTQQEELAERQKYAGILAEAVKNKRLGAEQAQQILNGDLNHLRGVVGNVAGLGYFDGKVGKNSNNMSFKELEAKMEKARGMKASNQQNNNQGYSAEDFLSNLRTANMGASAAGIFASKIPYGKQIMGVGLPLALTSAATTKAIMEGVDPNKDVDWASYGQDLGTAAGTALATFGLGKLGEKIKIPEVLKQNPIIRGSEKLANTSFGKRIFKPNLDMGKPIKNTTPKKVKTQQAPQQPQTSPEVQVSTPPVTAGTRSQKVPVRGTDTGSTETRLTSGGNTRLKPGQVAEKPASNLETPFVETPALKSVSVGSPLKDFKLKGKNWADYSKEDRQHEGRELYNRLQNKGDDYKGEGYQAEILQELKKSNPNIVKELRDAKGEELEKLIQKYFKKGGLIRKRN